MNLSVGNSVQRFGPTILLLGIFAFIPYVLIYLKNLWLQPHYQFYPLVLLAVGVLIRTRWGGPLAARPDSGRDSWLSKVAFIVGLLTGIGATMCASIWMGFFAFTCMFASWLSRQRDGKFESSLVYLILPIALIWQPPYGTVQTADTILIQNLQMVSARLSSKMLDAFNVLHVLRGTVLDVPGKSFGVAEACSGIQSFFAILCIAALLIVYLRRGLLHALLLMSTGPVWAVLMNTVRITVIPIAYNWFSLDLSHGVFHDLLGFGTMGLAGLMLLSTDEILAMLLPQRSKSAASQSDPQGAGSGIESKLANVSRSKFLRALHVSCCIILLGCFGLQLQDTWLSWNVHRDSIDFFRDSSLVELYRDDLKENWDGWPLAKYDRHERGRENDDLGERSDVWQYTSPVGVVSVSFDQKFPGWHELTRCYRSAGWNVKDRRVFADGIHANWPMVAVDLIRNNETSLLLFGLIDNSSSTLTPPGAYNYWTILRERLQGRLTPTVRAALFGKEAFQIQCFVSGAAELTQDQKDDLLERFIPIRDQLWEQARQRMKSD